MSEEFPRHVEVIYCDDIREEVGGKVSYMGIYNADMYVPTLPLLLPKLCIAVKVVTPISDPFQKLSVKIEKGDQREELLSTGELDVSRFPLSHDQVEEGRENKFYAMLLSFVLAPFQIEKSTILRVSVETERGIIRGHALRIQQAPGTQERVEVV